MRPDKKKTRHHDSVKCENKAKAKAAEKAKKEGGSSKGAKKIAENKDEQPSASSTSFTSGDNSEYKPRQVTSNWTKYEIPSSDEDEEAIAATGPDFQFVLENASKASDHLQLKGEKDWNTKQQEFNSEFFALNLNDLQDKIDCLPWQQVLNVQKNDLDEVTLEAFTNYAEKSKESLKAKQGANYQSVDEINRKIVESLKVKVSEKVPAKIQQSQTETSEGKSDDNLEDWLNDYLS